MRLPTTILYTARAPQNENAVPFKELLPLKLRNHVSGKSDTTNEVACLQEMAILFACLKENDFVEKFCSKEIANFKGCYKNFLDRNYALKQTENQGVVTPGKKLHYKQLNRYLRRFPNPE